MPADDAVLRTLIGPPLGESFRTLGVAPERVDHAVEVYRRHYAEGGVTQAVLYDGIAELLHSLHRRGVRLGVATAKRVDFARLMLERLGVADLFDAIAGASLDLRNHAGESARDLAEAMGDEALNRALGVER